MDFWNSDWIGMTLPPDFKSPGGYEAVYEHVKAVEAELEKYSAGTFKAYWENRSGRACLRHYFNRAINVPEAHDVLQQVLCIACGADDISSEYGSAAASMLLAALTNPACSSIPVTEYPELARCLLPIAQKYRQGSRYQPSAVVVALARFLSKKLDIDGKGGSTAATAWSGPTDDEDLPGPLGR